MPPKSAKGSAAGKQKPKEDEREETLQAVVLADSYERKFSPFTLERPRCLLPLANAPLIEYTFEFIASAGIQEVFVYCGNHADQVEEYINASKWRLPSSPFTSLTFIRTTSTSIGDALRDLDKRDIITGDFLLVSGDVVSNISIDSALAKHRARREKDKNAIMTMILREAGVEHKNKPQGRRPVFVIDPKIDRCLHYEEMGGGTKDSRRVDIDPELLSEHAELDIRSDLIDCYIDICTLDVLGLWSDNFDYLSLRNSFLFGVLKDYELNGKTLHTHVLQSGYTARVRSLRAYDAVSKDIIGRWVYPYTLDSNIFHGQCYSLSKNKVYVEEGVVLARGSVVKQRSVIGKETSIGDKSVITNSVIGRRCHIGRNVSISGCYIWDDVVIGDNSVLTSSIVANEAAIGRNCTLQPGSLISYAVNVSDRVEVHGSTRLTRAKTPSSLESSKDTPLVGEADDGHEYYSSDSDSSQTSAHLLALSRDRSSSTTSLSSISTLHSEPDDTSFVETSSRRDSTTSYQGATSSSSADFVGEATASIQDGIAKGQAPEVIHLELMGQRLTANASDAMIREALVKGFLRQVSALIEGRSTTSNADEEEDYDSTAVKPLSASEAVNAVFGVYQVALLKPGAGRNDATKQEKETERTINEVALLQTIETESARIWQGEKLDAGQTVLLHTTTGLYGDDVVQSQGVLDWWERGTKGEVSGIRKKVAQLVDYIQNQESSDEDDEDESESEEDD